LKSGPVVQLMAIPYNFQTADSVRGKKKELIYQGRQEDTLRFRYREYINDIVRPAYDQTVEYNIGVDDMVTFRGMQEVGGSIPPSSTTPFTNKS
jgi:hypothetical protein